MSDEILNTMTDLVQIWTLSNHESMSFVLMFHQVACLGCLRSHVHDFILFSQGLVRIVDTVLLRPSTNLT